jgi:hypothetical protein
MNKLIAIVALVSLLPGCGAFIASRMLVEACPTPAFYDSFHNLQRTYCASDAQWAKAVSEERGEL